MDLVRSAVRSANGCYYKDNCYNFKLIAAAFACPLWRFRDKSSSGGARANIVVQSDGLEWDRMGRDNTCTDRVGVEDRFKRSHSVCVQAKFNLH